MFNWVEEMKSHKTSDVTGILTLREIKDCFQSLHVIGTLKKSPFYENYIGWTMTVIVKRVRFTGSVFWLNRSVLFD